MTDVESRQAGIAGQKSIWKEEVNGVSATRLRGRRHGWGGGTGGIKEVGGWRHGPNPALHQLHGIRTSAQGR